MPTLLIATTNQNKLREYAAIFAGLPLELRSLRDLGIDDDVEETGATFAENARLKAEFYAARGTLSLRADEIDLVRASHLVWRTPEFTLQILGIAQLLLGLWLIVGLAERIAVFIAATWMLILIVLVVSGNPSMLTDPYGALVKDFCLIACATTVWILTPLDPVAR